jgi:hypothetical protein
LKSKFVLLLSIKWITGSLVSQELSPYIKVGESVKGISEVSKEVIEIYRNKKLRQLVGVFSMIIFYCFMKIKSPPSSPVPCITPR